MYKLHTNCRACDSYNLIEVFDLGFQPLANDFRKDGEERAGYAPLKVLYCPRCSLAQLSVVVKPEVLYSNYSYVTSPSITMENHFLALIRDIAAETDGKNVLEIGSNDGLLLRVMKQHGYSVQGVDPAQNLVDKSLSIVTGFFGSDLARVIPVADIVIARHVFCHVDDWHDFVRGLEAVSRQETLICIEVPYAGDTVNKCEFDQVYHEHLSFLSIRAVEALLKESSLRLHRIIHYSIHGGALLLMLRHKNSVKKPEELFQENITLADWESFAIEAKAQIGRLKATVQTLKAQGKRIAGLGASAKSTVWVNACGFTRKDIAFIADNTLQKQLTCSPGTDIPVVDEGAILRELPDYVVMFAWNYKDEVLEKFALARSKGVRFIIPVPIITVV